MSFKEHYWQIPLHMYDDAKTNVQVILDTGAIQKSNSHWASTAVLV